MREGFEQDDEDLEEEEEAEVDTLSRDPEILGREKQRRW
jgi:hypothetical protein